MGRPSHLRCGVIPSRSLTMPIIWERDLVNQDLIKAEQKDGCHHFTVLFPCYMRRHKVALTFSCQELKGAEKRAVLPLRSARRDRLYILRELTLPLFIDLVRNFLYVFELNMKEPGGKPEHIFVSYIVRYNPNIAHESIRGPPLDYYYITGGGG